MSTARIQAFRTYRHVWTEVIWNAAPPGADVHDLIRGFDEHHRALWKAAPESDRGPRPARILAHLAEAYCRADGCSHPHHPDGPCQAMSLTPEGDARCWCEDKSPACHVGLTLYGWGNVRPGDLLLVTPPWDTLLGRQATYLGGGRLRFTATLRPGKQALRPGGPGGKIGDNKGCCG